MAGSTPTSSYTVLNNSSANATAYKGYIDANSLVAVRSVDNFAPHSHSAGANMTIDIDAGHIYTDTALTEVAAQTTGTITAPSGSNKRIDRAVIDNSTGVVSVVTGTPTTGTPTAPAIPSGSSPVAQIGTTASPLLSTTTAILNSMLVDERDLSKLGAINLSVNVTGSLSGLSNLPPIAANTILANPSTASATPQATVVGNGLSLSSGSLAINLQPKRTVILSTSITVFNTSSNISTNTVFTVIGTGGGGGGGGAAATSNAVGSGGGAGGTFIKKVSGLSPSSTYILAIGSGGTAGSTTGGAGGAGGNTTFNDGTTTYTSNGGTGGLGSTNSNTAFFNQGSAGGSATNGDDDLQGGSGFPGISIANNATGVSGGAGGISYWGPGGATSINGAGSSGLNPGSGGGGGAGNSAAHLGGVGASGKISIEWLE